MSSAETSQRARRNRGSAIAARFLLAKEGWLTAVTGLWFLGSLRARRPLAYQFSRPLLEGRLGWPADWDTIWRRAPRFRRMWRAATTSLSSGDRRR